MGPILVAPVDNLLTVKGGYGVQANHLPKTTVDPDLRQYCILECADKRLVLQILFDASKKIVLSVSALCNDLGC